MNLFENLQMMQEASISEKQKATTTEIKNCISSYLQDECKKHNKDIWNNEAYEVYINATDNIGDTLLDKLQIHVEKELNIVNIEHVISENEFYTLVEEVAKEIGQQ